MSDDNAPEPFERIKPHDKVLADIRLMQDNLRELHGLVRMAEWQELGGLGDYQPGRCERLCDAVEGGMPHIKESIQELPNPYEDS